MTSNPKMVQRGRWKGAYTANVKVCPKKGKCFNKKSNSFFPDSWSKTRVRNEIHAAYIDAIKSGQSGKKLVGRSATGGRIEMFVKKNGDLITAYPAGIR